MQFTAKQYDEAIENLRLARQQLEPDGNCCKICGDDSHQAWECAWNPLRAMAAAKAVHERGQGVTMTPEKGCLVIIIGGLIGGVVFAMCPDLQWYEVRIRGFPMRMLVGAMLTWLFLVPPIMASDAFVMPPDEDGKKATNDDTPDAGKGE